MSSQLVSKLQLKSEISALTLSCADSHDYAYVTLYDAPYYSLNVVGLITGSLHLLYEHSLAADMELD